VNYYYLADDQKPIGPLPLSALQTLAASSVLKPDTLVIQEGGADWTRWGDLEVPDEWEPPGGGSQRTNLWQLLQQDTDQTPLVRFLDQRLDRLRKPGGDDRFAVGFQRYARIVTNLGSYGVLLAGVLILLGSVVVAIRIDAGSPILSGVGAALLSIILHYLAVKFSCTNERLMDRSPVMLPTDVIPRTMSLLSLIAAVGILVFSIYDAIHSSEVSLRLGLISGAIGILAAVLVYHVHLICSFPKHLLNVECLEEAVFRAGEYYANLVKYSARLLLRMGALVFGYGMLAALAALVINGTFLVGQSRLNAADDAFMAAAAALGLALLPMVIHFLYLATVLVADLVSAIFEIERNTAPQPSSPRTEAD
jgi:hypothetical protein